MNISGLFQVLSDEPLEILFQFCRRNLNLRATGQENYVLKLKKDLPVVWHHINQILQIERSTFLPNDLQQIFTR